MGHSPQLPLDELPQLPLDELPQMPSTRPNLPQPSARPNLDSPSTTHKGPPVMRGGASLFSKADMEPEPDPLRLRRVPLCKRALHKRVGADALGREDADVPPCKALDAEDCDHPAPALRDAAQEVLRAPGSPNCPQKGFPSPNRPDP